MRTHLVVPRGSKTVENLFDQPINYYAAINFKGFRAVIDAMGGISLPNCRRYSK